MFSAPSVSGVIDIDDDSDNYENCNYEHHEEMANTPTQTAGSRIMLLKLKKARLETQVAYNRTQLLLAEIELQMMEQELQNEVKKSTTPEKTPTRPQETKRTHKFVKILRKAFKPSNSNQNIEEPDTTASTSEVKEDLTKKRKNVETNIADASGSIKKFKSSSDKFDYKENRNTSRSNKQDTEQKDENSKKNRKEKTKSSDEKKKSIETGIKNDKTTKKKHSESNKKDKITKESKAKHGPRKRTPEKTKEKDDKKSKEDKGLKSVLKKSCITEATNKNVPEKMNLENTGEGSVEFNIRTMFDSPTNSNNNSDGKIETTTVDKATNTVVQTDAFSEIRDAFKKGTFREPQGDVVKVVDAMLYSLENNELFKDLRNMKTEKHSSLGSMETLVLEEEFEDRKIDFIM